MEIISTLLLPFALLLLVCAMLLSCACWKKHKHKDSHSSVDALRRLRSSSQTELKAPPLDGSCTPVMPNPFLPPSLCPGTPNIIPMQDNIHPQNGKNLVQELGPSVNPVMSLSTPVACLARQDSNSHRNCELPPLPCGSEYMELDLSPPEPQHFPVTSRPVNTFEDHPSAGPSMGMETFKIGFVPARNQTSNGEQAQLFDHTRYSICDDPQSESDGLYASVGHSVTGSSCAAAQERTVEIEHRNSSSDSNHAPYYSSVASVNAPNEYGGTPQDTDNECEPVHTYSHPPLDSIACTPAPLYARVRSRPRHQMISADSAVSTNRSVFASNLEASDKEDYPVEVTYSRVGGSGPPVPERGYDESEIKIVNRSRRIRPIRPDTIPINSDAADRVDGDNLIPDPNLHQPDIGIRENTHCEKSGPQIDDGNMSLIKRLLHAIQIVNARHDEIPSDDRVADESQCSGPYHKITVRESLASLRARNALPPLFDAMIPSSSVARSSSVHNYADTHGKNAFADYERVYGPHGDCSSSTYEAVSSSATPHLSNTRTSPSSQTNSRGDRLSDAYTEIQDTVSFLKSGADVHSPNHPYVPSVPNPQTLRGIDFEEKQLVYDNSRYSDARTCHGEGIPPIHIYSRVRRHDSRSGIVRILAEMEAFRHMDSDVDLTRYRTPIESPVAPVPSSSENGPTAYSQPGTMDVLSNTLCLTSSQLEAKETNPPRTQKFEAQFSSSPSGNGPASKDVSCHHGVMTPLMERSTEESSLNTTSQSATPSIRSGVVATPSSQNMLTGFDPELCDSTHMDGSGGFIFSSCHPNDMISSLSAAGDGHEAFSDNLAVGDIDAAVVNSDSVFLTDVSTYDDVALG